MILVIDKSKEGAGRLSDIFFYMGIPSFATGAGDGLLENCPIYRSVIILFPEKFYDIEEYVSNLHSKNHKSPIFAVSDDVKFAKEKKNLFDATFDFRPLAQVIYEKIEEYSLSHSLESPSVFRAAYVDASLNLKSPTYFSSPIPFTKTEAMILRTLISSYPSPLSSRSILKYAFKPARAPELSSIRTHISLINKKSRETVGKPIISLSLGEGYKLSGS